ncbi:MAG: glycosyltransferase family 4 protein, partial [Elusimicrobia bacterium]|nr:glycosyltransferase family 4 protein [Elusimicrobiota bacterium]
DIALFLNGWGEVSNEKALFVIAGNGSQEKKLKDIAEKNKMKNVVFAGKRSDILRFYRASDYFVLPSRAEGLSNALLEAMSCGLTAIVSDIPSNREIIEDGKDGFLFSFERPEELDGIIKRALSDKDGNEAVRRKGEAAREKIVRNYSISAAAQNHVNKVYDRFYD